MIEDINFDAPKTKLFAGVLKALNVVGKKTLVVLADYNDNVYLSLRNMPMVESTLLADLNTYEVVNADTLILTESAAKIFSEEEVPAEA